MNIEKIEKEIIDAKQQFYQNFNDSDKTMLFNKFKDLIQQLFDQLKYNKELNENRKAQLKTTIKNLIEEAEKMHILIKNNSLNLEEEKKIQPEKLQDEYSKYVTKIQPKIKLSELSEINLLERSRQRLIEYSVLPAKFPQLFQGARCICSQFLLYGPNGVGKQQLIEAIANESNISIIKLQLKQLINCAQAEQIIKQLFKEAKESSPVVIQIQNIDLLFGDYNDEKIRRVKTEILVQLSGKDKQVQVMATTKVPWNIDAAIRRRFELRFYIKLPTQENKIKYFKNQLTTQSQLESIKLTKDDINEIGNHLEYYNMKEINQIIKSISMHQIKKVINKTKFLRFLDDDGILKYTTCEENDPQAQKILFQQIPEGQFKYPTLDIEKIVTILKNFPGQASKKDLMDYEEFTQNFGIVEE